MPSDDGAALPHSQKPVLSHRADDMVTAHAKTDLSQKPVMLASIHTAQQPAINNICVWLNILPLFKRTSSES